VARLIGPLLSTSASGTLAGVLTYQTDHRGTHVRKTQIPSQPRTRPQLSRRAVMRYLVHAWTPGLTKADRETWAVPDGGPGPTAYNNFCGVNARTWQRQNLIQAALSPTSPSLAPNYLSVPTAVGGPRAVTWTVNYDSIFDGWCHCLILGNDAGFSDGLDGTTDFRLIVGVGEFVYVAADLQPGHYWPAILPISRNGDIPATFFPAELDVLT
jgi:hypothetical protein